MKPSSLPLSMATIISNKENRRACPLSCPPPHTFAWTVSSLVELNGSRNAAHAPHISLMDSAQQTSLPFGGHESTTKRPEHFHLLHVHDERDEEERSPSGIGPC